MQDHMQSHYLNRDPVLFRKMVGAKQQTLRSALVIEDDEQLFPVMSAALKEALPGIRMDWVVSAEQGLLKARKLDYEIIIADVFLSGRQTGISFWKTLRNLNADTPVIITSSMSIETFLRLLGKEAEAPPAYVRKPIKVEQLKEIIQGLMNPGPCS